MRFEAGSCSQFFGSLVRALSVGVTELTLASCEYEVGLIGRETGFAIVTKQKLLDGDTIPALTGSYAVRKPPLDKKSWINDTPSFSLPAIGRVRPAGPLASSSHAHHDYHLGGGSRHHTSGSEAPRTVLVYCRRCISSRLQWTTAFLQLFLQPCCGPQCYSHLYAVASKPCYAPLRIAAIFLLPSFSHSQRLSTAAMAKFLLWPGLYHINCSYYFHLPLVMSGTCHSCLDTEAVLPVSEDVPVGHLQHHLGGDPERG